MRTNTRFLFVTLLILFCGFASTSVISYVIANRALNHQILTNTLPITSDNIYSEIQRDLLQPVLVSSLMAQDTFVREWAVRGENPPEDMVRYLDAIQTRYDTITAFFVSDRTRRYYHSSGVLKTVSEDDPQDAWYFPLAGMKDDFEVNLDVDTSDTSRTTLFVNHKTYDFEGRYLGAIGVGLASETLGDMIAMYRQRYQRTVYFIDRSGNVVLKGEANPVADNISREPGIKRIATRILTSPSGSFTLKIDGEDVFVDTRFVPELDWYIVVEQQGHQEEGVRHALWINLGVSLIATLAILVLAYIKLRGYQSRLQLRANTDQLTGTISRHGVEDRLDTIVRLAREEGRPFSVVLLDIDNFKQINDRFGHLVGDQVLVSLAAILKANSRESDTVCRWGGEEFLLLLPDCNQEWATQIAEKLRRLTEESLASIDGIDLQVTASFGVAESRPGDDLDQLFARADKALYKAKIDGRNLVRTAGKVAEN